MPSSIHEAAMPPVYRTAEDQDADRKEAIDRIVSSSFDDWPNEAGFDGLSEERGPIEIPVIGSIPAWAAGNLFRTGPGQSKVQDTAKEGGATHYISHWFDGLAHTHRFEIVPDDDSENVRVFYSSRRQSEPLRKHIQQHGSAKGCISFGQRQDPCMGLMAKFMATFKAAVLKNRVDPFLKNTNVVVQANVPGIEATLAADAAVQDAPPPPPPAASPPRGHRNLPDSLWIATDANVLRRVDPRTLEPLGEATQDAFHPDLCGQLSCAHAERDPVTGDYFNFNLSIGPRPTYRVFRVSAATGQTDILATIRCANGPRQPDSVVAGSTDITSDIRPAYIHSFFLTQHYAVLCIPCTHIAHHGLPLLWTQSIVGGLEPYDASKAMRWVVVDRRPDSGGGVVAEFESPARFFFHSANAYEDAADGSIVCDVVDYATADIIQSFYYDVLMNRHNAAVDFFSDPVRAANASPCLSRYRLPMPPTSSEATPIQVLPAQRLWSMANPHCGEMPTINPAYATRPHRYTYTCINQGYTVIADGLSKADTATRSALLWRAPHGHTPSEAIFLARPGGTAEDDGVLLSVVLDGHAGTSYLLCLDARTMQETGRAEVGFAIGIGFHGIHTK